MGLGQAREGGMHPLQHFTDEQVLGTPIILCMAGTWPKLLHAPATSNIAETLSQSFRLAGVLP